MSEDAPRESRPANAGVFGKRTEKVSTSLDPETKRLATAKARALGYTTLAEWMADLITVNVRGLGAVTTLLADRLKAAVTIGAESNPEPPEE